MTKSGGNHADGHFNYDLCVMSKNMILKIGQDGIEL